MSPLPQEMTIIFGSFLKGSENGSSFTRAKYLEGAFCAQTRQSDKKLSIDKNRLVAKCIRRRTLQKDGSWNNY